MRIPASAIRPFEPHGIPKTLMGEAAVSFLVTNIARSIIGCELNGLTMKDITSSRLYGTERRIREQLAYGGLERISVSLLLRNENTEIHCKVGYVIGGNERGASAGFAMYEE